MDGRDPELDKNRYHLLLLAENMTGYRNLLQICSDAQLDGYYYRPRIDADYLAATAEGLICTSGCLAAELPTLLKNGQEAKALERLQWYRDVFGARPLVRRVPGARYPGADPGQQAALRLCTPSTTCRWS